MRSTFLLLKFFIVQIIGIVLYQDPPPLFGRISILKSMDFHPITVTIYKNIRLIDK